MDKEEKQKVEDAANLAQNIVFAKMIVAQYERMSGESQSDLMQYIIKYGQEEFLKIINQKD